VVEHRPYKPGVAGSKPAPPTNKIMDLHDSRFSSDRPVPVLVPVAQREVESCAGHTKYQFHSDEGFRQLFGEFFACRGAEFALQYFAINE
jgi:hypothetical protein